MCVSLQRVSLCVCLFQTTKLSKQVCTKACIARPLADSVYGFWWRWRRGCDTAMTTSARRRPQPSSARSGRAKKPPPPPSPRPTTPPGTSGSGASPPRLPPPGTPAVSSPQAPPPPAPTMSSPPRMQAHKLADAAANRALRSQRSQEMLSLIEQSGFQQSSAVTHFDRSTRQWSTASRWSPAYKLSLSQPPPPGRAGGGAGGGLEGLQRRRARLQASAVRRELLSASAIQAMACCIHAHICTHAYTCPAGAPGDAQRLRVRRLAYDRLRG